MALNADRLCVPVCRFQEEGGKTQTELCFFRYKQVVAQSRCFFSAVLLYECCSNAAVLLQRFAAVEPRCCCTAVLQLLHGRASNIWQH